MSLLVAVAAAALLWTLVLTLRAAGAGLWQRSLTPSLALVVLGLPLVDHSLRHLALPLFFVGSGFVLLVALIGLLLLDPNRRALLLRDWGAWSVGGVLLAWLLLRGVAPSFDSFGENIFSLRYVQSLRLAEVYPAADLWEAAPTVAGYYTWLHNIAAWLSRVFLLPVPMAMHLASAALLALMSVALYEAFATRTQAVVAAVGAAVVMFAGTGLSILLARPLHSADSIMLGYPHVRLYSMGANEFHQPWMAALAETSPDLPVETPLHVALYLGDFHPPLLGFALVALLVWAAAHQTRVRGVMPALLGALPVLIWAANPWFAPHAFALAAGWWALDVRLRRQWRWVLMGLVSTAVVIAPILMQADFRAAGVSFSILPATLRSPFEAFMAVWWPALALAVAAMLARDGRWRLWLWLAALVLSMEFVHFNQGDISSPGARFNGVLKVWSPLHFLMIGLGMLGVMGLRGRARWVALLAVPLVLSAAIHGRDLLRSQINKGHAPLEWSGAGKLTQRADRAFLLRQMQALKPGRSLERLARSEYDLAPLTSLLAAQPTASGWAHHMSQASGDGGREQQRVARIRAWFEGRDAQPLELLRAWDIGVVLVDWDADWKSGQLSTLQTQLAAHYLWLAGPDGAEGRVSGLFVRMDQP
ncbi:hypothetical protein [Polycyclovorans algicola]|uniref:hypothetical protein n=1 Tax=Polycyclovorans algicola TaxID=616992 RepID=UPI0004A731C6|nr:hypothetical protein [Polycyclovorans algicola]